MTIQIFKSNEITENEITELVRGNEQQLLDRLGPLVRSQNVTLDLAYVARIDAPASLRLSRSIAMPARLVTASPS